MKPQSFVRPRNLRLLLGAALLALSGLELASAQVIVQENFTGDSVTNSWYAQGGACLTAGDSSTPAIANGIGIPPCVGDPYYFSKSNGGTNPTNTSSQLPLVGLGSGSGTADPIGKGALRLTNGGTQSIQETGAIIAATPFPSTQGIQVTFTTYTYGGNAYYNGITDSGADGIAFYLMNGGPPADGSSYGTLSSKYPYYQIWNPTSASIGAFGGSLGYSCANGKSPSDGMPGGYLGLGIDEFGNYLNSIDNTATGIDQYLGLRNWSNNGRNPGEIGLRGYGAVTLPVLQMINPNATNTDVANVCANGGSYKYGGKTYNIPDYAGIFTNPATGANAYTILPSTQPISNQEDSSHNVSATRFAAKPITYKLVISPGGLLSFWYNYNNTGYTQVINQLDISTSNGPMPSAFYYGFGASTGGGTNVHEITCFEATPAARTIGAPVAPLTVSSNGFLYTLSSNQSPVQGYLNAYALTSSGTASTTSSWEAGALMSKNSTRSSSTLKSTASNGSAIATLATLASSNSAAFALSKTTCVPAVSNIVAYTVDPNTAAPSGCSQPYLGTRAAGSVLDAFGTGDYATLLSPPSSAADALLPNYLSYATTEKTRPTALLFSNDDGFLYSIDATTGALRWGWMPRSFLPQLQNYSSFPYADNFAGKFAVVDAQTTAGGNTTWGTYIVGSAQGGTLWYDLALDSSGNPSKVVTTFMPKVSSMPSNTQALPAGTTGYPQRQAPVIGNIGGSQYAAFIVNDSSSSTLVEFNVATGASSSATLPKSVGLVTSALDYDPSGGELYFGNGSGTIYVTSFSGSASVDVGNVTSLGTTEDSQPVIYIGTQTVKNLPYLWAVSTNSTTSTSMITVFGIGNTGWSPLWASGAGAAYTWGGSSWSKLASSSTTPASLQANAIISDAPRVVNGVLVVPAYVPPPSNTASSCNPNGEGFYDFFALSSGAFPSNTITQNGNYLTGNLDLGQGQAYTPNLSIGGSSLPVYGGTQQASSPMNPLLFTGASINQVVQWRVR